MYKSKLQEICQKRSWSLPKYSTTKHGLDHIPTFSTTLLVYDISFHTLTPSHSSKESQNDAAKLAFDHFSLSTTTPATPSLPPPSSFPQPSLSSAEFSTANADVSGLNITTPLKEGGNRFREVQQHLYKSELQIYAQKRNMVCPVYSCERQGPPHASRFRCRVTVGGADFESGEYFLTLKEAELAAAKLALDSLSPEDDSGVYKNLLQEIAQKEGMHLPIYNTQRSGELHSPVFVSTVELNGDNFVGEEAKSKKQAEISAARVAYNALKDKRRDSTSIHSPPTLPSAQKVKAAPDLLSSCTQHNISDSLEQRAIPNMPMILNPITATLKAEGIKVNGGPDSTKVSNGSTQEIVPCVEPFKSVNESSSTLTSNDSADTTADSGTHQSSTKLTLAYKKISVYPANKPIPTGSILLPNRDQNWIAFCAPEATSSTMS